MRQKPLLAVALAFILVVALGLRLYGLDWDRGYGYTPHPDERAILGFVGALSLPALNEIGVLFDADESPLNPGWFNYGSFPLYLLKGVQLAYSGWQGSELLDLRVTGRIISALADVGTVMVVYLLGAGLYGRREGLLASALVALAVIHIQLSHYFAVDTLLGLFTVATLYFLHRVAREGRLRDSLVAGIFIGLGVATKVSMAPIYIAFVMAHLLFLFTGDGPHTTLVERVGGGWRTALKGLAVGAAASVAAIVLVQPYSVLDWSRFYGDFIEQSEIVRRIRDYPYTRQYIDTTPYWYHIRQLATWGLGWPLGVVAWAGLLYASLRGMRIWIGLAYLGLGWALPAAVLLYSASFPAILVASGIAFAALAATLPFRSKQSRPAVLLLAWVAPYFLITGAFQVKFMRYLIPMTPVLLLFGSMMSIALWDRATDRFPTIRPWLAAGGLILMAVAALYALSYMAIYAQPHTAVRSADWIIENAPRGSVILMEHWEEGLPNLGGYDVRGLPLYDDDTPEKLRLLSEELAGADYLVFFSNRLYGTIPRLPERYPISGEYYRLLFSGALGYELANVEMSYPRLAGVSIVDDTFGRPDVPRPAAFDSFRPSGISLDLGFADESFSVYDHPLGLVFRNAGRQDADAIGRAILDAAPQGSLAGAVRRGRTIGLLLTPEDAEAQRQGGTWSEIIRPDSWTNQVPVVAWLLLVEVISLLAVPVAFILFRPLGDRGYLFAKPLGLVAVCLVVWLLASSHWMAFSRGSIAIAILLLGVVSGVTLARRRREIVDLVRSRWKVILVGEALFLLAFFAFVAVRMANPDLWHPFRGGEKPMEMAYLNAVLRSSYMPPYDPWFGGGYLNYYYWGQFIVATLIKATGIEPRVAFNLAVPTFFAMTVAGAFSIVYNLAEGTRRRLGDSGFRWSPVLAGLAGGVFVVSLGNLDGAIQVGQGVWRVLFGSLPFGEFDFWRSSRMMPPDPPGFEITEFPFFTYLFADLHPNLMSIPFTLLALGLALAIMLGVTRQRGGRTSPAAQLGLSAIELARLAALGVTVGAIRVINTWDYPTYLIVAVGAVFLAAYFRNGGLSVMVLVESASKSLLVFLVGYLVFLPFHLNYETFFTSIEPTTNQTVLWQFLGISGLFVFAVGSYYVHESRDWLGAVWRAARRRVRSLVLVSPSGPDAIIPGDDGVRVAALRVSAVVLAAAISGYVVSVAISGWLGSTVPFLVVMATVVLVAGARVLRSSRADAPQLAFVAGIVGVALALAIGLDIFRVEGDIERMNSVFKFYLQIWVLMALASAYLLWRLAYEERTPLRELAWAKKAWLGVLAVLIASASIYTVLGTQDRLRDRFDGRVLPPTLDGTAYIHDAVYRDPNGDIRLSWDYDGIEWLQSTVEGSPIILEGYAPEYRWGARISVYTGLPNVIGWANHQRQQRFGYAWAVDQRIGDVDRMYSTTDASEALLLLRRYGVEYVYVGQLERLYYPAEGLDKFGGALSEHLDTVYQNEQVTIYRVRPG